MSRSTLLTFMTTLILATPSIWAQEVRATISGRVSDATGAVVPAATVDVVSDDTGVAQHTSTNSQGVWIVQFLLPGQYHFTVAAPGFKKLDRKGLTLQAADNKTVDVQLDIGSVDTSIEVAAEVPLIDTTSATSGAVLPGKTILEMPSTSRVTTVLAVLVPGVMQWDQDNNPLKPWSYNGASQIDANGGDTVTSNNFQLDGMPNVKDGGYIAFIPPPDALQEFRVQTNAYDAQISRTGTMTINMETRSGTKDYHGSLYEFNQNNTISALPYGTTRAENPPGHVNQYGGTFGGPVWVPKVYNGREKTFFFIDYEGLRDAFAEPDIRSVPTELERKGDFSQSYTIVKGVRYPINIYDANTVNMTTGARQQFANNVIPGARQNTIAQNILKYVALPNRPSDLTQGNAVDNFWAPEIASHKMASLSLRLDHAWNNAHRSFGVAHWMQEFSNKADAFNSVATGTSQPRSPRSVGLDHVWTKSSNKVLDLRFSISRYFSPTFDKGALQKFNQASLGFPTSFTDQLLAPAFPYISGFAGNFGTSSNKYTYSNYYTWRAGFTHIVGRHTLKYGGEYWVLQQSGQNFGYQPSFTFGTNWTGPNALVSSGTGEGSALASFLLGLPQAGTVNNNASSFYSQRFTGGYLQDDWRLTTRLTLNLGLRWDYERPVTERFNRMVSTYDPTAGSPISAQVQANYSANATAANLQAYPGMATLLQIVPVDSLKVLGAQLFAGVNGQPRTAHNTDYREVQPRVGFAYRITPTLVIRGGIGRFTMATFETGGQTGFSQATALTPTSNNYLTPVDTLSNPFQSGILQPAGSSLGALSNLGNSPTWVNPDPERPYAWNYNLQIQKQLKNWLFEVGYVHTSIGNLWVGKDLNQPAFAQWQQLQMPTFDASGRPVDTLMWNQLVPNPFYKVAGVLGSMGTSKTVMLNNLLRPIAITSVTRTDNPIGSSVYDALQAKLEHRFSKGFSVLTSFTWSKAFDDISFYGPQIAGSVLNHSLSSQDRPLHFSLASVWDVPVGRNRRFGRSIPKLLDFIAGGWGMSGSFNIQSGTPVVFSTESFYNGQDFSLARDARTLANGLIPPRSCLFHRKIPACRVTRIATRRTS